MQKISSFYLAIFSLSIASPVMASDFSLPFVNSSGLGVAYADWASAASDASTSYTNPAGLVNLAKQQMVVNLLGITGTAKFTGSSTAPNFPFPFQINQSGIAKTKINAFMPSFYYASPISEKIFFGFNVTAPFGLGTNYDGQSIVRYASTRSQVAAIDIGPSFGFKLSDIFSFGAGLDAVNLSFTLNNKYGPPFSLPMDSSLQNHLSGWGLGWHAGTLINITPVSRLGISYQSKVDIKTKGYSKVFLPHGTELKTNNQETKAALPARAQVSIQHDISKRLTGMATVFYTNWKTFDQITMKRTMTTSGTTMPVTIPFNYHNVFDYALGSSFKATDKWILRGGVQWLNAPSNDQERGVANPIGKATIVTLGAQYQASETLKFDVGVGHSFFKQMAVNFANPLVALKGHNNAQTTAIGGQVTWDIT